MAKKSIKVLTERNDLLGKYGNPAYVNPVIIEEIEKSFQSAQDYSTFTGYTSLREEMAWWGFKHNEEKGCYILAITYPNGILRGYRDSGLKEWLFVRIA